MNGVIQKLIETKAINFTLEHRASSLFIRAFYKFWQKVLLICSYFIGYTFTSLRIEGRDNARKIHEGPLLVIANHKSDLDPLLLGLCFPFFSKIYPLRFMAWDNLFRTIRYGPAFRLLGAFPTYTGQGMDKSLQVPSQILKNKGTVIFFPEGKRIRDGSLGQPKRGIGVLALQFPNVQILPIAIAGAHKVGNPFNIFRRPRVRIKIGKPFCLTDKKSSLNSRNSISSVLMSEIEKNYKQIV